MQKNAKKIGDIVVDNNLGNFNPDKLNDTIIKFTVESWRFARVFDRMQLKLDAGEQHRYSSQLRWFLKKVDEALAEVGLHIVNVEGQIFDPGMAVSPLNIEEFTASDILIVDQMLEPIIMSSEGLVKSGTVVLRKVDV